MGKGECGGGYIQVVIQPYEMISLLNVMEKIINDSVTLFLSNILKLSCPYFGTCIVFCYTKAVELFGESHLRTTVYKFT